MQAEKLTKIAQLTAAVLALPAAAAGAYSVYRANFAPDVACQNLRASIVATMEKNVAADAKRALLKKDVADFEKNCGEQDPAAQAMFRSVLEGKSTDQAAPRGPAIAARQPVVSPPVAQAAPPVAPAASPPQVMASPSPPPVSPPVAVATPPAAIPPVASAPPPAPAPVVATAPAQPPSLPPPVARPAPQSTVLPSASIPPRPAQGSSPGPNPAPAQRVAAKGPAAAPIEKPGWVVLARRDGARGFEINFDGFPFSRTSFPPPGTVLTARVPIPMLLNADDRAAAAGSQSMVKQGGCVRIVSTRLGPGRLWGEVVPVRCGS